MIESFDIQGHRGARGLAPENTMPSFEKALELGVDTLELDTVTSADHQVVVSHDPWFSKDICTKPDGSPVTEDEGKELILFAMPYAEIARYDCGLRRHPDFSQQVPHQAHKPLLREVIAFAEQKSKELGRDLPHYNVETKSWIGKDGIYHPDPETFVRLIWEIVEDLGVAERFILQSFDVRTLQAAKKMALPIRLALLIKRRNRTRLGHLKAGLKDLGFTPDIYSPHFRLLSGRVVQWAHDRGMKVIPWTVNHVKDMLHLKEMGVDGLISDYPDVARNLFI